MRLEYVGGNSAVGTGATVSVSLTALTGGLSSTAAEGDIVVVIWGWATNAVADPGTLTMSTSGYTYCFTDLYANDTREANMRMAYKVMGSTPDTTAVCNRVNNGAYGGGIAVQVWRNVDTASPLTGTSSGATGTNSNDGNPPAITPAVNDAVVVCGMVGSGSTTASGTKTAPADYTTYHVSTKGDGTGADCYLALSARILSGGSGVSENPAAYSGGSTTTSDGWCAGTLALNPYVAAVAPWPERTTKIRRATQFWAPLSARARRR